MNTRQTVLIVDDDATFRRIMASELDRQGHPVVMAATGAEALAALANGVDIALVDLRLGNEDGIKVMEALHREDADLPVIMLTGHGSIETAVSAMQRGAYDFVAKPCPLEELERVIERASSLRKLSNQNARLRRLLAPESRLLGDSPAMSALREQIQLVASSSSSVLVRGESGTGKELVARAIHDASARSKEPFVPVNCAGIPETLIESELFGHERGAFTGADRRKLGLFEVADGGTLFLDEIGELHSAGQAKLLRVLQSGEMRRVAGAQPFRVDVRVIAATNRDLVAEIKSGRFREDLYYRLAILEVQVPALRDHPTDIVPLLSAFLARKGIAPPQIDPAATKLLLAHHWPGNVRELESFAERISLFKWKGTLGPQEIERSLVPGLQAANLPVVPLAEIERVHITNALRHFHGDKKAAAAALGVSLRTLYNRLKEYGLDE